MPIYQAHTFNALSSALSAEIKDKIEMEYSWLERTNLLWKVLEKIFGSSNDKKSSSNILEKISSSSTLFDQSQEGQSSFQEEEVKSTSLEKSDCPVSQTGLSGFDRTETSLAKEDNCSTSSFDDDDTYDEYDEQ
jgi:hypothetical protein